MDQDNMTLYLDPDTNDIAFDDRGHMRVLYGDATTAQCVRNTLITHLDEFELADGHGTDYDRIQGMKPSQLRSGEVEEVIREAVFQDDNVREVTSITVDISDRALSISVSGYMKNGNAISMEVNGK